MKRFWECIDIETGTVAWTSARKGLTAGSVIAADGRLYVLAEDSGEVAMLAASPAGYKEISKFKIPELSTLRKDGESFGRILRFLMENFSSEIKNFFIVSKYDKLDFLLKELLLLTDAFLTFWETVLTQNAFYRRKLRIGAGHVSKSWIKDNFDSFEFTSKSELQDNQSAYPPYGDFHYLKLEEYNRFHQTSGSSGKPLLF